MEDNKDDDDGEGLSVVFDDGQGTSSEVEDFTLVNSDFTESLLTWTNYRGHGMFAGLLAWIGNQRVGRIDIEEDGSSHWYCSLPSETREIDGTGTTSHCIDAMEAFVSHWLDVAGLMKSNSDPVEDPTEDFGEIWDR